MLCVKLICLVDLKRSIIIFKYDKRINRGDTSKPSNPSNVSTVSFFFTISADSASTESFLDLDLSA